MSELSTATTQPTTTTTQMGGKRKLSKWNKFVSKVYADQHKKNKNFQFKDALKMASTMKKKGHYGGGETFSDASASGASDLGTSVLGVSVGGRSRNRTMRRTFKRGRGRTAKRGRSRASRRH
jgi:hypothetical protein